MASMAKFAPSFAEEGMLDHGARVAHADAELLKIVSERSFRRGRFTLASGKESELYFNMKPTMMHARGAELSAQAVLAILNKLGADYVSGLEMGAVPVIGAMAAISSVEGRPIRTTFVRKAAKKHGTKDLIEGLGPNESLSGKAVVIVDDVATSGGSFLQAVEAVRSAGGIVNHAICIVDREEGALEFLADHDVKLHSVLRARDFS